MTLNLLLYSYDWLPLVGGIQSITADLAEGLCEWSSAHNGDRINVTLVTETSSDGMDDSRLPFRVIRRPSLLELIGQIRSADVVHIANPPLFPLALVFFVASQWWSSITGTNRSAPMAYCSMAPTPACVR